MTQEENYKVKERVESAILSNGSVDMVLKELKTELESLQSITSEFSYDCVYHGINCNKLMIEYIEREYGK